LEERETIDGSQDGVSEAARRFHFQLLIAARAEAGVDGHHDGKRQFRFAMKYRDLLRVAVLEYLEIILLERGDRRSTGDRSRWQRRSPALHSP
jgi:hypothetical protein